MSAKRCSITRGSRLPSRRKWRRWRRGNSIATRNWPTGKTATYRFFEGDETRGWAAFENPEHFAWSIRAYSDEITVSGVSLLQTLSRSVGDWAVLAIADQPIEDNISTMYLCGGIDSGGRLVGFVVKQVLT